MNEHQMTDEPSIEEQRDYYQRRVLELELRLRAADRLADEAAALVTLRQLGSRSPLADALLDYRDPPQTERSDRIASLEAELNRQHSENNDLASKILAVSRIASNDIADLESANALLRTQLAEVQGRVVEWIPASRVAEVPPGEPCLLAWLHDDEPADYDTGWREGPKLEMVNGWQVLEGFDYWLPISSLPLPKGE